MNQHDLRPSLDQLDTDGAIQEAASRVDGHTRGAFLRRTGAFVGGSLFAAGIVPNLALAAGKGDVANSWVGTGQNKPIAPADLGTVLTDEQITFLMARTGLSREELLAGLSEQLPQAVNHLTPEGRLPTPEEMHRAI